MHRFSTLSAAVAVTIVLAGAPAVADESADSARATAIASCQERAGAKNVTVAVDVDGKTTKHRYACSKLLAAIAKVPAATDFEVGIDVLSKQCFASAGCSMAYKIDVEYKGSSPLDPSKEYTVVYDVAGAESPITANFTIRGDKVSSQKGTAYLPTKDGKLAAHATSVIDGG